METGGKPENRVQVPLIDTGETIHLTNADIEKILTDEDVAHCMEAWFPAK